MKLIYSHEAKVDLQRLREFIAEKNPNAANRIGLSLLSGIKKLKDFPLIGKKVLLAPDPELIRDLIVDAYIVRYLITDDAIFILRIWHHREDWNNAYPMIKDK